MLHGMDIQQVRDQVQQNAQRVAQLGQWPEWISPHSLTDRIPDADQLATGFDAGVACALGLIPPDKQRLAAQLHAAYTPQAVEQVRRESVELDADSETTWWLAACSICTEGQLDEHAFLDQIDRFQRLASDADKRRSAARVALEQMRRSYELRDGVAYAVIDGGMQGAYIDGHDIAAQYAPDHDLYFLGTFHPSLGLDDFAWSKPGNPESEDRDERQGRSGPVHGSRQFVKCDDQDELARAFTAADPRLKRPQLPEMNRLQESIVLALTSDMDLDLPDASFI